MARVEWATVNSNERVAAQLQVTEHKAGRLSHGQQAHGDMCVIASQQGEHESDKA